jgi:hypothetical protein
MNLRTAIYILCGLLGCFVAAWASKDYFRDTFAYEKMRFKSPKMADGSNPSEDILDATKRANERFAKEKNWVERTLDPKEYPFSAPDFLDHLDSIVSESPSPVTCSLRMHDKQITGVTYPKRLERAVNVALQAMKKRASEQAGSGQPATRSQSKSEGGDKPQPEAEGRSR